MEPRQLGSICAAIVVLAAVSSTQAAQKMWTFTGLSNESCGIDCDRYLVHITDVETLGANNTGNFAAAPVTKTSANKKATTGAFKCAYPTDNSSVSLTMNCDNGVAGKAGCGSSSRAACASSS